MELGHMGLYGGAAQLYVRLHLGLVIAAMQSGNETLNAMKQEMT
jgi:hypothetical protein